MLDEAASSWLTELQLSPPARPSYAKRETLDFGCKRYLTWAKLVKSALRIQGRNILDF